MEPVNNSPANRAQAPSNNSQNNQQNNSIANNRQVRVFSNLFGSILNQVNSAARENSNTGA